MFYGSGCWTQEGLINPLAVDDCSGPGSKPGTSTKLFGPVAQRLELSAHNA